MSLIEISSEIDLQKMEFNLMENKEKELEKTEFNDLPKEIIKKLNYWYNRGYESGLKEGRQVERDKIKIYCQNEDCENFKFIEYNGEFIEHWICDDCERRDVQADLMRREQ